ncbi:hypothetical protein NM688_g1318 [Phlebia brevispora]|uniref:Uncharacterized protein n=1 Tax=Phlebia brevispora TaxID=194682 RepID=A0ACC1TC30_9APHY|nr:hypothetical protein NM688_g1318 [Phlebia brevispora]
MSTPVPNSVYAADQVQSYCIDAALSKRRYLLLAAQTLKAFNLALVAYEYLVTLEHEHGFIWQRKWNAATWLFIANRYMMLAVMVEQASPWSAQAYVRCYNTALNWFVNVIYNLPPLILAVFSTLRVFALLDRTAYITTGCVFMLGVAPIAINFYQNGQLTWYYIDDPVLGSTCYYNSLLSSSTLFYARFSVTLLRYGTLYFVVLFIVNLINLLLLLVPSLEFEAVLGSITTILPNIVVSRFLINLRQSDSSASSDTGTNQASGLVSTVGFRTPTLRSIVGNLGEPLSGGDEDTEDFELDELSGGESSNALEVEKTVDTPSADSSDGIEEIPRHFA